MHINERAKRKKSETFKEFRSSDKLPFKTVKTTLKAVLSESDETHQVTTSVVFETNESMMRLRQLIRLYVLKLHSINEDIPEISERLILYCMKTLGESSSRGRKPNDALMKQALQTLYEEERQSLLNHEKTNLRNKSLMLPCLATQAHIALSNNIQERFTQRLRRFVNVTTTRVTDDKKVLGKLKRQLLKREEDTDEAFDEWKATHLSSILPADVKTSIYYDVKTRPLSYLKRMLYMSSLLENSGKKTLQPLPLRNNVVPKHIVLDIASVIDLFALEGTEKSELLKSVKESEHDVWSNLLNLQHKVFKCKHHQLHHQA